MPLGTGRSHPGYHDHYVVDGGKARIILAALVTPAEVQDNQPAPDLVWWARFCWQLRPQQVSGLEKVNGEALLIAAGQNLKRLLGRRGWGRRPFPSGAAGIVLPTRSSLSAQV